MTVPIAALSSEPTVTSHGTHGVATMRVDAPSADVWSVIVAMEEWSSFVPYVTRSAVETRSGSGVGGDLDIETRDIEATVAFRLAHPPGTIAPFVAVPNDTTIVRSVSGMWIVTPIDADHTALELHLDVATTWWVPAAVDAKAKKALGKLLTAFADRATR